MEKRKEEEQDIQHVYISALYSARQRGKERQKEERGRGRVSRDRENDRYERATKISAEMPESKTEEQKKGGRDAI